MRTQRARELDDVDFGPANPVVRGARALRGAWRAALTVVLVASMGAFVATRGDAAPVQEDPGSSGSDSFSDAAIVDIEIDVEVADGDSELMLDTLDDIEGNVARQLSDLEKANSQVKQAQGKLDAADKVVAKTQSHIDDLTSNSDDVVTGAYVNAPNDSMIDTLSAESATDAAIKQAILSMAADKDAKVLAELEKSRNTLEVQRNKQAKLAASAQNTRAEKEAQLADLEAATSQQTDFVLAVSDRLANKLAEIDALKSLDPELAAELKAEQQALATRLKEIADAEAYQQAIEFLKSEQTRLEKEAAAKAAAEKAAAEKAAAEEAAKNPPEIGPASGTLASVSCPAGLGTITVDSSIEAALQSMVNAAAADGVNLCGGGYRSSDAQIELRKSNCGTTYYLIYEAPASSCSPPTARPGTSLHEQGLAIDFTCNGGGVIGSTSNPCYIWLSNNANGYGFYQLPSEVWHWSTSGS